jgi:hypothetical protein
MPFGLKACPKIFQKTVNESLDRIKDCFVYIDNIIIFSETIESHDETVTAVLTRLKKYKIEIHFEKIHSFLYH